MTVARPAQPGRTQRRAPADLPFRFADRAFAETLATERGEPDWLRADRLAATTASRVSRAAGRDAVSTQGRTSPSSAARKSMYLV